MLTDLETKPGGRVAYVIPSKKDVPTQYRDSTCRPAVGSPQLSLLIQPPQCQTSRRFMVSTGIQTYGSNGTGGVSRSFVVEDVLTYRDCRNQVLPNKEDGFAVKAILAHDAITHPDHPLRIAGKQGIELFIGELATYRYPLATQRPFTLSFQVRWKMAKRASCSLLRKSNTSATGCTQWASQKSLFRSHILTVFSRRCGYKITRPWSTRRVPNCAVH
jgi:hypothetical protein